MKNLIRKIKEFFKNIFSKNKTMLLEESKNNNETEEKIEYQKEKKEFFEIYDKIKNKQYDLNDLTEKQRKMVIDTLNAEIELKKEKLNKNITELNILKTDNRIEEKNRMMSLYKEVINKTIDLSEIDEDDLLKIRKLLLEETKIQDEKLEEEIQLLQLVTIENTN